MEQRRTQVKSGAGAIDAVSRPSALRAVLRDAACLAALRSGCEAGTSTRQLRPPVRSGTIRRRRQPEGGEKRSGPQSIMKRATRLATCMSDGHPVHPKLLLMGMPAKL